MTRLLVIKFGHIFEDFYLCLKSKQMLLMFHFFTIQPKGDHMCHIWFFFFYKPIQKNNETPIGILKNVILFVIKGYFAHEDINYGLQPKI